MPYSARLALKEPTMQGTDFLVRFEPPIELTQAVLSYFGLDGKDPQNTKTKVEHLQTTHNATIYSGTCSYGYPREPRLSVERDRVIKKKIGALLTFINRVDADDEWANDSRELTQVESREEN